MASDEGANPFGDPMIYIPTVEEMAEVTGQDVEQLKKDREAVSENEESPCINVCTLDEDGEYCTACGQTLQELMK